MGVAAKRALLCFLAAPVSVLAAALAFDARVSVAESRLDGHGTLLLIVPLLASHAALANRSDL